MAQGDWSLQAILRSDWPRLLSQLPAIGSGLMMSGNGAVTLCSRQPYPLLHFAACGKSTGADAEAGLWLDRRGLGAARAVHSRQRGANFFKIEFADTAGRIVHRFDPTPESNLDKFFAWLRLHQAFAAEPCPAECAENPVLDPGSQRGDTALLVAVLKQCNQRAIALRATVSAGPVTQRAVFTPRSLQPVDDWWFVSNCTAGLHFLAPSITQVRVSPPLGEKYFAAPALHADSANGSLTLEMGNHAQAAEWNAIVHGLV
jgi:hypothetical protein